MKPFLNSIGTLIGIILIMLVIFLSGTPQGREIWNDYVASLREVDEHNYENQVLVENEARLRIVAYNSAVLQYEELNTQCISTENSVTCSQASAKRITANNLAIQYNEYLLLNSHVWAENIPSNIDVELKLIPLE